MTLEEAKKKAYDIYMTQLGAMNNMIDDPSMLRSCGYKTLEDYLKAAVKYTYKEVNKVFDEYDRTNPS